MSKEIKILSKSMFDSNMSYDISSEIYKVRVDVYYKNSNEKKSMIIKFVESDLFDITTYQVCPERGLQRMPVDKKKKE